MVHRSDLPNGLRVITVPQPHLHTATVTMFVKVGCRHETPRGNGLSHLLEHMLFRGCDRYPSAHELNGAIEELGGTLNGATHADSTLYEVTLPPRNVTRGIEILGGLFARPRFADLAVEKRIVREEILESLDEDGHEVDPDNLARKLMFGAHPLGMTITGSVHNVERFSERDLHAHMKRNYVASNMVLCVAGAVDERSVLRAALASFGSLPSGVAPEYLPAKGASVARESNRSSGRRTAFRPRIAHVKSAGSQSEVRLSFSTFGANDPRHLALELLLRVLDDGLSTRLHRRICAELGLAYEAFATLEPYEECGVLDIGAAAAHAKVPTLIAHVLALLEELADKAPSQAELEKAKRRYAFQLEAILDDTQSMCSHYGLRALLGQEGHLEGLRARIERVTAAEVRAVARELFCRERLHVVVVGMLGAQARARVRRTASRMRSNELSSKAPRSAPARARARASRAG